MNYFQRKAAPWVSLSVLLGGMVSAVMLLFLVRVENDAQSFAAYNDHIIVEVKE